MTNRSHMLLRLLTLASAVLQIGCATQMTPPTTTTTTTTMTLSQLMEKFPGTTKARYVDSSTVPDLLRLGICTVRVADRRYLSPNSITMTDDLRRGAAHGVDDFVVSDGANAYVIKAFDWVQIDGGLAHLALSFDTLECLTPKSTPTEPLRAAA